MGYSINGQQDSDAERESAALWKDLKTICFKKAPEKYPNVAFATLVGLLDACKDEVKAAWLRQSEKQNEADAKGE